MARAGFAQVVMPFVGRRALTPPQVRRKSHRQAEDGSPHKKHRRTGMYTGAAICGFTAVRTKAHMEGSPAQGAGPSSGSLEIRVRCSRRKHSSETIRENTSEMG